MSAGVSPLPRVLLSLPRALPVFLSTGNATQSREEMVKRCRQVFGQNHSDGTVCSCPLAHSLGMHVCVCSYVCAHMLQLCVSV